MNKFEIVVPTLFGIESVAAAEIRALGYEVLCVEDGRVTFAGDERAVCDANIWLRTGERVLIKVGEFYAVTFDELFEKSKALDWSLFITRHVAFPVKGFSVKSTLFSVSDCQSIIKKSIVESLKKKYAADWFDEQGAVYQIVFSIIKDKVTLMIDTTGQGLHKRGYRPKANAAPLSETVAAALVSISYYNENKILLDPFCGSGTIAIEAAMIAKNMPPGINRSFAGEKFSQLDKSIWTQAREQAKAKIRADVTPMIYACDIDPECIALTKQNSASAGVGEYIRATVSDMRDVKKPGERGVIITNPPYGMRLDTADGVADLYRDMGRVFAGFDNWLYYILTAEEDFERYFGRRADKKRKIYNGMIKCDYYQYFKKR